MEHNKQTKSQISFIIFVLRNIVSIVDELSSYVYDRYMQM